MRSKGIFRRGEQPHETFPSPDDVFFTTTLLLKMRSKGIFRRGEQPHETFPSPDDAFVFCHQERGQGVRHLSIISSHIGVKIIVRHRVSPRHSVS
jgi:hypothetical protein